MSNQIFRNEIYRYQKNRNIYKLTTTFNSVAPANQDIPFDTIVQELDDGLSYSASVFTCNIAGIYVFNGAIECSASANGERFSWFALNGALGYRIGAYNVSVPSALKTSSNPCSAIMKLEVGDTVVLYIDFSVGVPTDIIGSATDPENYTRMEVFRII